jgi:NADH-quinone oxidoreductase subunit E
MAQINKDYYEDLTPESFEWILTNLKAGREVVPGPQNGRQSSESIGGPITLTDPELYRNEEQVEENALVGASLTDREAKRPGKSANQREAAVPKPPLGSGRKPRSR